MPYVYRAFDHSGRLLYVGRAKNWASRWAAHSAQRPELFRRVMRLEMESFASDVHTDRREAELIACHRPPWNRRLPGPPDDPWLRCPRCGMSYQAIKDEGDRCDDMSGWGGTFESGGCPGVLVICPS